MTSEITVIIMTYNQKDYIKQAIDSVLSQKIDINFDILIHDDCSSDGTYEILCDYQKRFPNKIKIVRQESRKFLIDGFNMMIFKYVVPHIDSKFVAYCDGDDYWCDEFKLQKQYKFLKENDDYSMCFHNAYQLKRDGDMSSKWFIQEEGDVAMSNLVNDEPGIRVATSSIFLKSSTFKNFSNWRKQFPVEDVPMYMTAALDGKIHRLKDVMCVYRQFASGSWTSQNKANSQRVIDHLEGIIRGTKLFDIETKHTYHNLVELQLSSCEFRIAFVKKDFKVLFSKEMKKNLKKMSLKERISLKLQYRTPRLYSLLCKKDPKK